VHETGHEQQEVAWIQEQHKRVQAQSWCKSRDGLEVGALAGADAGVGSVPACLIDCLPKWAQVCTSPHSALCSLEQPLSRQAGGVGAVGEGPQHGPVALTSGGDCLGNTVPSADAQEEPWCGPAD